METLIKVAQFFLSLSLLIVLHEWGHYFFARLFKTRVNKFYLFFDFLFPVPTLLNFALFKKKKGDTEFGIGWFPFGGYVQIDGMMDETQDADKLKNPPQPWEFRSKKAWQRLLIMMGGIIVNVLTAFLLYGMILYYWGEKKIINDSLKNGISVSDTLIRTIGFRDGDRITGINGEPVKYFDDVLKKIIIGGETVQVGRNGETVNITIPQDLLGQLSTRKIDKKGLIGIRLPAIVDSMPRQLPSNAFKAGLQAHDQIVQIDSTPINYWGDIAAYTETRKAQDSVQLAVMRGGRRLVIPVMLDANKKMGILPLNITDLESRGLIAFETRRYGFWESFPAGTKKAIGKLKDYFDQFALLFKPSTGAYKGMGGFASMTQVFSPGWDWEAFWNITAFFSIALAFMNFLPIPMLDGGYILFTLVEMLTGRKLSDKVMEKANMIGFVIIIGLMVFTNGNDIFRKFMGWF
jgi:regulator of sigma E protease